MTWALTGQVAVDEADSSHHAIPRHFDRRADASSGTPGARSGSAVGAGSGSAVGASGGAAGAPTAAVLFAVALVAAGCWSRLVLLLRRYRACISLPPLERPG